MFTFQGVSIMDHSSQKKILWGLRGKLCVENLIKHRFDAHLVSSVEEARRLIISMSSGCQSFGFGGSDTIRSLGIIEHLKKEGKTIYDHNQEALPLEASIKIRKEELKSDCFLASANAISMTGEIVNVDGVGNRTSAISFGPGKVIIVAGINKLTTDLESALKRVKEVAAPMRAKSLNMPTPCAETGICTDCNAPMRICNITLILHRKPILTDISIILVNEELGY